MDEVAEEFSSLQVDETNLEAARALGPIYEKPGFGKATLTYRGVDREKIEALGTVNIPSVSDVFTSTMKGLEA